jgi:hypothetical protein
MPVIMEELRLDCGNRTARLCDTAQLGRQVDEEGPRVVHVCYIVAQKAAGLLQNPIYKTEEDDKFGSETSCESSHDTRFLSIRRLHNSHR